MNLLCLCSAVWACAGKIRPLPPILFHGQLVATLGSHYHVAQADRPLRANKGRGGLALWGTKGSSKNLPGMMSVGNGIVSTPSGKKLPEALRLLMIDTDKMKDQYHYRIKMAADPETRELPGAAFLHSATGEDYAAQVLAEEKQLDDKGRDVWTNVHGRPNHLFDADLLSMAGVEMEFPGGGLRLVAEYLRRQKEAMAMRSKRGPANNAATPKQENERW